ncbi:hypothetical protein LGH70_22710 [Hymenobacter sp. BT635]|uniref:Uncharacterized protein n=1 Tax=Hymenobacter nitidus TaxID=2880929 RepID=A0ABS8AKE3_9BACT|nr:hypothetical protein [Hymenobacter nitidus]MCB2380422.1 hypothetical protein [Hymenobacter nitidus]
MASISTRVSVTFFVSIFIVLTQSCKTTKVNNYYNFPDKLEHFAIIGFKSPPKYMEYTPENIPFYLRERQKIFPSFKPGESISFWCYATYFDNFFKPVKNLKIDISVVKSTGEEYSPQFITSSVITNELGYNAVPITLIINEQFTYRLKVKYKDKNSTTISYSPVFKVSTF